MCKKITALMFCALFVILAGCKKNPATDNSSGAVSSAPSAVVSHPPKPVKDYNNLTGLYELDKGKKNKRPVAIMINNIKFAQPIQTGINKADIIYETEVEGGISRLMAVYKDISKVGQIGSVRSARYVYVDLALAHDAIYLHCGQDPTYCKPHLSAIDDVSIDTNNYCKRVPNGLAWEHTLYAFGDKIAKGLPSKFNCTTSKTSSWQNFADKDEQVTLNGGVCNSLAVTFSSSYITKFSYNSESGVYTRLNNGSAQKDYCNGQTTNVKNVFILLTSISYYPNKYRRYVALDSGNGYYVTNGTYTPIKWKKGGASSPLVFTNTDGSALKVNAGKSWVCISSKTEKAPAFQ